MGCDPCKQTTTPASKEYLLVQASAQSANQCGTPSNDVTNTSACPKQEPTFDSILSSFVVPEVGTSITVSVCNVAIYVTSQFVHFPAYGLTLQIIAVDSNNKTITLRNACSDGINPIEGNPDAGQGVSLNSAMIISPTPRCSSADIDQQQLDDLLNPAIELCVPSLDQTSLTAEVQIVGRTESDPANSAFKKCIRRVTGLFFKSGSIRQPSMESVLPADYGNYKPAGIEESTGQMRKLPRLRDFVGIVAGKKYVMAGTTTTDKPVGPAYFFSPITKAFGEVGTITDDATYTNIANGATFSQNFAVNITEITDAVLNKDLQDHYYLELKLIIGMQAASGSGHRFLTVKLNDVTIGVIAGTASGIHSYQTFFPKIKILNADTNFNLKLVADGSGMAYYYKIDAVGVFI